MPAYPAAPDLVNEREVTITRIVDAPRRLVFEAWTDPAQVARWWGPQQFDNPVCEVDARPGGRMNIHMRGPDGTIYPMTGTFREVSPHDRLVFMAVAEDADGNALLESLTTVTFADEGSRTRLVVHAAARGLAPIAPQMLAGMQAGWTQSLDKLDALMASR